MDQIIPPIDKRILVDELKFHNPICITQKGNKHIYSINHHDSPNLMLEIGRIREHSYRNVGSGTGKKYDIDNLDTAAVPYKQLIIWDPEEQSILGGYRYIKCIDLLNKNGDYDIGTARLFKFSEEFKKDYLPTTIELGRSFVRPEYQVGANVRKGLFVLDNLWEGLGALVVNNPEIEHFFGEVSIFADKNIKSREIILYFLKKYFPDNDELVRPIKSVKFSTPEEELAKYFDGDDIRLNHNLLSKVVRSLNENIPPLINTYINTSPKLKTFGAIENPFFNNMFDIGILITIKDIYETKKNRYIYSMKK